MSRGQRKYCFVSHTSLDGPAQVTHLLRNNKLSQSQLLFTTQLLKIMVYTHPSFLLSNSCPNTPLCVVAKGNLTMTSAPDLPAQSVCHCPPPSPRGSLTPLVCLLILGFLWHTASSSQTLDLGSQNKIPTGARQGPEMKNRGPPATVTSCRAPALLKGECCPLLVHIRLVGFPQFAKTPTNLVFM